MSPPAFLLIRPEPQSLRFAEALCGRLGTGFEIVISPVMGISIREVTLPPEDFSGLIFTSENAVIAARCFPRCPAWCVGDRTAATAKAAGFHARSASGDADALVAMIVSARPESLLLHLRGAESRGAVAERLVRAGLRAEERVVYDQVPLPLAPVARDLLDRPGVVVAPLFSPRSAEVLAEQVGAVRARLLPVGISAATAESWQRVLPGRVEVAARPDAKAMLDACERVIASAGAA